MMRSNLSRLILLTLVVFVSSCATVTPAPTPAPTAVVVQSLPTQTPYPTATLYPTQTPYPTATPYPTNTPLPTASPTATPTETPTPTPTFTPRPAAAQPAQPAQPVGSAALWQTPGTYQPVAPNLCATYGSSFAGRDWQETFCIIKIEIYGDASHNAMRFYGDWKIKLVRGTPKDIMFHPSSRDVTYVVDNLGNKYIYARLGGAADADVKVYGNDYLLGYKDNDSIAFPHEPSAWWEFVPAASGASSFTFVNDKYGFRIGPIILTK